jgi:hypothetical protein
MGAVLVSRIMPVWNPRPEWLREAVRSCLDQQGCRVELIVVDDGCPGPAAELLDHIRDPRLRILRVDHGGVSNARNAGMASARGTHLRFVDSDDVLPLDSTARLLGISGGADAVISYGATDVCDDRLRPYAKMVSTVQGDARVPCVTGRFDVHASAILFPRPVIQKTGLWDSSLTIHEDWNFVLRATEHASVRGDVSTVLLYRRHDGSATGARTSPRAAAEGTARIVAGYLSRHPDVRGTRLEHELAAMALWFELLAATGGRPSRDRRFLQVLRYAPHYALPELRRGARAIVRRLLGRDRRSGPGRV